MPANTEQQSGQKAQNKKNFTIYSVGTLNETEPNKPTANFVDRSASPAPQSVLESRDPVH